jgi:hypothetical protein
MNIKIDNYQLEPEPNATTRWNLRKFHIQKTGKKAGEEVSDIIAYAVTIPRAVEIISADYLADKYSVVSLGEFLAEYKKTFEKFKELVQNELTAL